MAIAADIIIAVILIAALALGVKRGLLAGVAGVVSVIAAFLCAPLAAEYLTPMVEGYLQPLLMKRIERKLQGQTADSGTMLGALGFDGDSLATMMQHVAERVRQSGEDLIDAVAGSAAHSMAYAVVYLMTFLLLVVIFRLLAKALEKIKLPGLSQIDSIAGGLLGLAEGALLVFIIVWVMRRLNLFITSEMIEQSIFLKFFTESSPMNLLTSL